MLPVFPVPQPEELFYSVIARFGDMMGFRSQLALKRVIFGSVNASASMEMPMRLPTVLSRLPSGSTLTVESVLEHHSVLPFFRAFLPRDRVARGVASFSKGDAVRGRHALTGGQLALTVKLPKWIRFCSMCVRADRAGPSGVGYWRRAHQLPGIIACGTHGKLLCDSNVLRSAVNRGFISLERALREGSDGALPRPQPASRLARAMARDAEWLLTHNVEMADHRGLATRYAPWLHARRWSRNAGGTHHDVVRAAVAAVLTEDRQIASEMGVSAPDEDEQARTGTPQAPIAARKPHTQHPSRQLLLLYALGVSAEEFFGDGPASFDVPVRRTAVRAEVVGPCGNPVCVGFDPPVPRPLPEDVRLHHQRVFIRCGLCGFTYGQTTNANKRVTRTVMATGPLWDAALIAMVAEAATVDAISARLGLDYGTLHKQIQRLQLQHPNWRPLNGAVLPRKRRRWVKESLTTEERSSAHKQRWRSSRARHPTATRSDLNTMNQAAVLFLREHDPEWLKRESPRRAVTTRRVRSVDWIQRDQLLAARITEASERLRAQKDRPTRITGAAILREAQIGSLSAPKARGLLPLTVQSLLALAESDVCFAIRRLHFVALEAAAMRTTLPRSALETCAGMPEALRPTLRPYTLNVGEKLQRLAELGGEPPDAWRHWPSEDVCIQATAM